MKQTNENYGAFPERVPPDDHVLVDRAYQGSEKSKNPFEIDHRLLRADGRGNWVSEIGRTEYDDASNPIRSIVSIQDLTERKRVKERLREGAPCLGDGRYASRDTVRHYQGLLWRGKNRRGAVQKSVKRSRKRD
jgi:hypothetical protein